MHAGIAAEELPVPIDTARFAMSAGEWKRFLRAEDKELCAEMRVKTGRGLVVGSERFKKTVARRLHRSVRMFTTGEAEKEQQIKGAVPFKNVLVSTMCSSIKQIIPWK